MPSEDDALHDEDDDASVTVTAVVGTTSVHVPSSTTLPEKPTDHIDRPVNQKPTDTASSTSAATTTTVTATTSSTSGTATSTPSSSTAPSSDGFMLPSIFPTFGVSPRTQVWIYGAIVAILIFCSALGAFFCIWRRRQHRTERDAYEFEVINNNDIDGAGQPLSGEGRRKRRAGELYDAFAGESDEEIFSEAEEEYKDEPNAKERARKKGDASELSEKR